MRSVCRFLLAFSSPRALSVRETLRMFPMTMEGHVDALAEFHNSSNEHGFIFHSLSEVYLFPLCTFS